MKTLSGIGRRALVLLLTAALFTAPANMVWAEEPGEVTPAEAVEIEAVKASADEASADESEEVETAEVVEVMAEPDPAPAIEPVIDVAGEERFRDQVIEPEFVDYLPAPGAAAQTGRSSFTFDTEYRVRTLNIDPIELNGESVRDINWTEQRLRMNANWALEGIGGLVIQFDALNGVLFGDNGSFLGSPASNSGVSLSAKTPNLTRWEIGLRPGGDPLDRQSYGPMLTEADLLVLNYVYADAVLPVGLLRVGRQPLNYGATITAHDGGRHNRWGVSTNADATDRILFATKLDEIYNTLRHGDDHVADASQDQGLIWAVFYDLMKQDNVALSSDNLRQLGTNLQLRLRERDWFGLDWKGFALSSSVVHLSNQRFDSSAFGFPTFFETGVENVFL
jgi:hypothetical protein